MHPAEAAAVEVKPTPKQRIQKIIYDRLHWGPIFAGLAVDAEISDRQSGFQETEPAPMEFIKLMEKISKASSNEERCQLLLQPVPYPEGAPREGRPELWFDYIDGFTSEDIVEGIESVARKLLPQTKSTWEKVVDLGAGTGVLGATLIGKREDAPVAESVTLVDLSPSMLKVAGERYSDSMERVVADVTHLPFPDENFDLAVSAGLVYSLSPEAQAEYFKELSRVLKPGGLYLDGDYNSGVRRSAGFTTIERFQLKWLLWATTSRESPFEPLRHDLREKGISEESYFEQFGLSLSYRDYKDKNFGNDIRIRTLEKTA